MRKQYDAVIVGAGLAGCTAAILFGKRGARVALIDRNLDPGAYKRICTHFIQASASPVIDNLGLGALIEGAGGLKNYGEFWTRWGWIREPANSRRYGYNIRRETLDPLLRKLALDTPGVDAFLGCALRDLLTDQGRTVGVRVENAAGQSIEIRGRLIVGADGRNSQVARLSGLPVKTSLSNRFTYFTYYRDLPLAANGASQLWLLDPDVAYACQNDSGLTMIAVCLTNDKFESWKADLDKSFVELFATLADAPNLDRAVRVSPFLGAKGMHHVSRTVSSPGLALVGDAGLAPDPLWGVGCGWAFQSAAWLVDCTGSHLADPTTLDKALRSYHRYHRHSLGWHERLISRYANGRGFNVLEKLMLSAAARDAHHASSLTKYADRSASVSDFISPSEILSAVTSNAMHWVRQRRSASVPSRRRGEVASDI